MSLLGTERKRFDVIRDVNNARRRKRAEDPFSEFDEDEMWKEKREEEEARWETDMDAVLKEITFGNGAHHRPR